MRVRLVALATAVPPHTVTQADAKDFARQLFREVLEAGDDRLLAVFDHAGIAARNVAAPLEWFGADHDFAEKNALYVEHAVQLGARVASETMAKAGLTPRDIDHLVFVSSTGVAAPSIDARLANVLGLRGDFRRTPIWGLGCAGGVAGLARAREFALADPGSRVLVVALELCSLTFQRNDLSKRNLVAASLFGDGAAAALVTADASPNGHAPLELVAASGTFWPDTLDVMGWDVDGAGLHVVFARDIPTIVHERVRPGLSEFLGRHGLTLETLDHLVAHPGGTKVLAAYQQALGLPPGALGHARAVLRDHGNMSSPTCLFVLERFLESRAIAPGQSAVLSALGPGFCAEYVLMRGAAA
ncbi:MAG TPA: 3-oxoacyl-[acyl-carrier-protein] synthase III C-terminal domain-containing protein [Candidatus Eisenbacteria bacterium]|nr:3-oxoacyl-[acyl-carrier-protein] synthase III C-terminal domain-containing protein [Candidatus Eisenbacteria bacterium]